jgi:hypothetical protein
MRDRKTWHAGSRHVVHSDLEDGGRNTTTTTTNRVSVVQISGP